MQRPVERTALAIDSDRALGQAPVGRSVIKREHPSALFRKIDCFQIPVSDLEAGLSFYRDRLGHALNWRTDTAAGLRIPDTDAEIVLQTERPEPETDLLVGSVEAAVRTFIEAGGSIVVPPFDIPIGRYVVVADPWGNRLVLLDLSKGVFVTEPDGSVRRDASGSPVVAPR